MIQSSPYDSIFKVSWSYMEHDMRRDRQADRRTDGRTDGRDLQVFILNATYGRNDLEQVRLRRRCLISSLLG